MQHLEPDLEHGITTSRSSIYSQATLTPSPGTESDSANHIAKASASHPVKAPSEWGLKANLTVLGAFLALFCTFGQMNSFGTYQTWYKHNQLSDLAPSTISWIGSLQLWVFFFSGGPIGCLYDRFGPTCLMIAGSTMCVIATVIMSVSREYYQYLIAQGILFGLGVGLMFYPSFASVSSHFSRYRATALGLAAAGSSVGGAVYPIVLERAFGKLGFSWGVRVSGIITIVCCGFAVLTVSSLPSARKPCEPTGIGAFTDTPYILLVIGSALIVLGLFIPFFYVTEYAHQRLPSEPVSTQTTFCILAILNAGGVLGRIVPAYLSDRLGRFNLLFPSALLSGLSSLIFWMCIDAVEDNNNNHNLQISLMIYALTYGIFSGSFISLITPCIVQISDLSMLGLRIGVLYTVISFPSLVGGPTAGALLVHDHGSYIGLIAFSGSTVIAGSFFILLARFALDSRILTRV